jgi:CBS domain-containing protein
MNDSKTPNFVTVVDDNISVKEALDVLLQSRSRLLLVKNDCKIIGTVSEGDFLRVISMEYQPNKLVDIMNNNFIYANESDSNDEIKKIFKLHQVLAIPILDDNGDYIHYLDIWDFLYL